MARPSRPSGSRSSGGRSPSSRPSRRRAAPLHAGAAGIEGPWLGAFEQAWEAYRAGDIPAGAVLTDPGGEVVARGRNRVYDHNPPRGHLGGTPLAHAIVDLIGNLPPERRFEGHTLWVTTEPCPMCVGAAIAASVEQVRFASADVYAGAADHIPQTPHADRVKPAVRGPLPDAAGLVGAMLQLEPFLRHNPDGSVVAAHKAGAPQVVSGARRLLAADTLSNAAAERRLFADVLPHLLAVAMATSTGKR